MNRLSIPALLVVVIGFAGCQSSGADQAASDTRTLNLTNLNSQSIVQIPANDARVTSDQPFALQGTEPGMPAAPVGMGYQAR